MLSLFKVSSLNGFHSDLLPPLLQAQVTRIARNGQVLKRVELTSRIPGSIKAEVTTHAQIWWVLVHTSDLTGMYDDLDPLDEIAERQGPGNGCWPAS